jgi:carboxymethylenebutenolidase
VSDVRLPGSSTPSLRAHLAVPAGDGPWPGVVVLHEVFGLTADLRRQADRLAAAGYLAVAPDLYSAGGAVRCLLATFRALNRGACPVVASYGRRDPGLRGAAARLESTLTALGVEHDVREYEDAGHSFLNRHGPLTAVERVVGSGFHEPSAKDAWERILAFFDRTLR